jgi:DNA-binding XRE family transcriptional regulator
MANIGTILKEEISRLSRRVTRSQIDPTQKATARHRRDIASLKRQVAQLERKVTLLSRKLSVAPSSAVSSDSEAKKLRFAPKRLRAQRTRLALSGADLGKLVGVSPQTIYNWEQGSTRPRPEQLAKLAVIRRFGKREARARLDAVSDSHAAKPSRKNR